MRIPSLVCAHCGGQDVHRSRNQSFVDSIRAIFGSYPFRCDDCKTRFYVSIWLVSKLAFAKCPKCLRTDLSTWSQRFYRGSITQTFLVHLGAQKYRCSRCRYNFVSFRLRRGPIAVPVELKPPEPLAAESIRQS